MASPLVSVFFYGSYMNRAVLREVDLEPSRFDVARLPGYRLVIQPLANLVPSDEHTVYGVLAEATHEELDRLYTHAREILGGAYLPRAEVVHLLSGQLEPALCYLAHGMDLAPANADYVARIASPARELGFPRWYIEAIEAFAP